MLVTSEASLNVKCLSDSNKWFELKRNGEGNDGTLKNKSGYGLIIHHFLHLYYIHCIQII